MKTIHDFLESIADQDHKKKMEELFQWIQKTYPNFESVIKWNQPMFTNHGTYIIGFSVARAHFAMAPEAVTIQHFEEEIKQAGYAYTNNIIKVDWQADVDYDLISKLIDFNVVEKEHMNSFWR